jgi:hypothetical protein
VVQTGFPGNENVPESSMKYTTRKKTKKKKKTKTKRKIEKKEIRRKKPQTKYTLPHCSADL